MTFSKISSLVFWKIIYGFGTIFCEAANKKLGGSEVNHVALPNLKKCKKTEAKLIDELALSQRAWKIQIFQQTDMFVQKYSFDFDKSICSWNSKALSQSWSG